MAVPDDRSFVNQLGRIVADITVRREVITNEERFGHTAEVIADPRVTRHDAVAMD